jgi:hypothetical protein
MNKRQSLVYGQTGQEVEFYAPEWVRGVPTGTPTYSIWEALDSNDNDAELSGNGTIDSVSTTVDQTSGWSQANRRRLYVAATTSTVRGRPLVLANANGQRELVTPDAIASADYIDLSADLAYDYPITTSTLKGLRMSFVIDSTWIADESNLSSPTTPYRVLWTYTIDSVTYRSWTYFDVVRQRKMHSLTVDDLVELWPDLRGQDWGEQRGQGFAPQLDAAFERIEFDARMHKVDPNQLRDQQGFDELMRSAAIWMIARTGTVPAGRDVEAFQDQAMKQYHADFAQAIAVLKMSIDQGKEGSITERPFRQPTFRR